MSYEKYYHAVVKAPFGAVGIVMVNDYLTKVELLVTDSRPISCETPLAAAVAAKIKDYFQNPAEPLNIQLKIAGSDFQQRVWMRLLQIPPGNTQTYGQMATLLNSSARAVGNAYRSNPCPLVIPCHRVVSKTGLVGFFGQGAGPKLEIKRWLLTHEGWL